MISKYEINIIFHELSRIQFMASRICDFVKSAVCHKGINLLFRLPFDFILDNKYWQR